MRNDFDLSRRQTAANKSSLTGMHKNISIVAAKVCNLESANATLREKLKTLSSTHAEVETDLAKNPRKARENFWKKTEEGNALRAKDNKLEKELASLLDASKGDWQEVTVARIASGI